MFTTHLASGEAYKRNENKENYEVKKLLVLTSLAVVLLLGPAFP